MTRPAPRTLAIAAAAVATLLAIAACARHATPAAPAAGPRTVRIAPVESVPLDGAVRVVGLLAPKDEARLAFKVGGVVERIRVEEGARVRRGEVLATLKQAEIAASVEQARAAAGKAERDLTRGQALYADGVATQEQVEDLTTAARVARAALATAEFNGRYARIEAPADGLVLRRLAEPAELVQAGQPVLVVGGLDRGWIVKASLADRDVVAAAAGDVARVTFDAWPGRTFVGRVTVVSTAADPSTGTFPVEVQVEPGDARFVQGLVAKVALAPRGAHVAAAPVVPVAALLEANDQRATVYRYDAARGTAARVAVRIGRLAGDRVEVLDGLAPGDRVVVEGAAFLSDGEPVQVAAAVADAAP